MNCVFMSIIAIWMQLSSKIVTFFFFDFRNAESSMRVENIHKIES